jgi:hypothetical protein
MSLDSLSSILLWLSPSNGRPTKLVTRSLEDWNPIWQVISNSSRLALVAKDGTLVIHICMTKLNL